MTWRKSGGLVLGFSGVALIVQARLAGGVESAHGVVITIAALLTLVTGTILFKLLAPRGGLWVGAAFRTGGCVAVARCPQFREREQHNADLVAAGALAYVALCVSIAGLLVWFYLLTMSGDGCKFVPFSHAAPRRLVRLAASWRTRDVVRYSRDRPVAYGIYLVTRPARSPSIVVIAESCALQPDRRCHDRSNDNARCGPTTLIELEGFRFVTDQPSMCRRLSAPPCNAEEDREPVLSQTRWGLSMRSSQSRSTCR